MQTASGAVRGAFAEDTAVRRNSLRGAASGPAAMAAPQPPARWQGVRDATKFGARCTQDTKTDPDFGRAVSEDCLT